MEQAGNSSLFGLSIDSNSKLHLAEAARWGRFLAIIGFILCGLIVLLGLFAGTMFATLAGAYSTNEYGPSGAGMMAGMGGIFSVLFIVMALIYFFPCLFLFRFASNMKTALLTNEQDKLNASFQNLKACLRFVGILTIIILCFYILGILFSVAGAMMVS